MSGAPPDRALDPTTPPAGALWTGGPTARPAREDLLAALAAFGATVAVLGGGLTMAYGLEPARAWSLGGAYAAVVAATTVLGRLAGVGLPVTVLAAFFAPVALAAALTGREGLQLVCPLASALGLALLLVMRLRQRRATRYWVAAAEAGMGEVGRYLITFPVAGLPVVRPDRFGAALGDIDFGRHDARLVTRDGATFVLSRRACRFHRVAAPDQVVAALRAGPAPGKP